jgi:hypothetical protein
MFENGVVREGRTTRGRSVAESAALATAVSLAEGPALALDTEGAAG